MTPEKREKKASLHSSILRSLYLYFFTPRYHFSQLQFNLITLIFIVIGFSLGTYFTLNKIFKSKAANDTVQTWTFNTANAGDFTYDNQLVTIDNAGARPVVNKLLNSTFDADLSGWTEVPEYALNDQFSTDIAAGSLNGTSAIPTGGTRLVTDTTTKLSTSGGKLLKASGGSNYGNPGLWYNLTSRARGKVFTFDLSETYTSGVETQAGFDSNQTGTLGEHAFYFQSGNIGTQETAARPIGSFVTGSSYRLAIVLRTSGAFYYIKGPSFTNWTLAWIDNTKSSATMYPAIIDYVYTNSFSADNFKIPTRTWVPTPLIYDSFTRADGSIGSSEATGPDAQTVPATGWSGGSISGNKLTISPILEGELVSNGNFDTDTTGWSIINNAILSSVAGGQSGNALQIQNSVASNGFASQNVTAVANRWYQSTFYHKNGVGAGSGTAYYNAGSSAASGNYLAQVYLHDPTWTQKFYSYRATATGNYNGFFNTTNGVNDTTLFDSISVKPLTLSSLFSTVTTSEGDLLIDTDVTLSSGTQAGIVAYMDSPSTPNNFILAYHDGRALRLDKNVAGTYTNLLNVTLTYVAGATLRLVTYHSDASTLKVRVYYNGAFIGTEQTITDASVINNTRHGLFSTYSGNVFDNFAIWARGSGTAKYTDAPFDELTVTQDTTIKRNGNASARLVASSSDANYVQSMNVGDTSTYILSVYAYKGVGQAVSSSDLNLYFDSAAVATTFTPVGSDWYRLTATITGVASAKNYGVRVKAGQTINIDDVTLYKHGTYSVVTNNYTNTTVSKWDSFCEGTISGGICTPDSVHAAAADIKYQFSTDAGTTWQYYNGSSWITATNSPSQANIAAELTQTVMQLLSIVDKQISVRIYFETDGHGIPSLSNLSIGLTTDITPPTTNADNIVMYRVQSGTEVASNGWTNEIAPVFNWTSGADNAGGVGMKGYCLYLGTDSAGDPATAKGLLGTSPVNLTDTTCQFITSTNTIDFSTALLRGSTWLTSSTSPYYLNIKAIDLAGNVYGGAAEQFQFRFDTEIPTNVAYIAPASGNFSNVVDMNFSWPTTGGNSSNDTHSQVLGWQYQINGTSGAWKGTLHDVALDVDYIPTSDSTYTLTLAQDGSSIVSGDNIIYFRTIDTAGNVSSNATIRTGSLKYGGAAPTFGGSDSVTVSPSTNTTNAYSLDWPTATATAGRSIAHYFYMINTAPPATLETLLANSSTYIDVGTNHTVATNALPNVNKGTNTIYVVAIDDGSPANYSPSNYISQTFTLNSNDPDNAGNLTASDSSIKSDNKWMVTLTWTSPVYQGAGNLNFLVYRSADNSNFVQVGTTTGNSYVDTTPQSATYYYKIYTKDGANAQSSGTNSVSIFPTGKWTTPPTLESGPTISSITTKRALISWSTNRASDSKVQFGKKTGIYDPVEPSNSSQVTAHSLQLSGLSPNTVYYMKAKWTDEDGNTGISDEKSFTTAPAPTAKNVTVSGIGLSSALVKMTTNGTYKVKIYYGVSTAFGGLQETATSPQETTYSILLSGLNDGTKYYYKINTVDAEGNEYDGTTLDFTTLPRPLISNVRVQQVSNTAQTTLYITWNSNTAISSIISYYPVGKPELIQNEVNVDLVKGEHKLLLKSLQPKTQYVLIVKGQDKVGNEAISDTQTVTTATDTRPPKISELAVEGMNIPPVGSTAQTQTSQLVISWNTDEPSTSQVEFSQGTGSEYAQMTQLDSNLTTNHLVVIANLSPSNVYHLRAISVDSAGNSVRSFDTVTITPKESDNALELVIFNLQQAFGFSK